MRIAIVAAFAAGLAMAGPAVAQSSQATPRVEIGQPWARATPGAARAELHESAMAGMVMKMRPLSAVAIPAGQSVAFAPGGMHIMLLGLKAPLREGQSFPLTLTFAKAGTQTVTVAVGKVGAVGLPAPAH
jgi:copper(I)-binding protein